jgi:UV DNA damage endonuclease
MILPPNIVPSLCCIHTGLQEHKIKFNVMTYAQYKKLGSKAAMKVLADRSLNNIKTIRAILGECAVNSWNYRIGSNVFPLMTHPDLDFTVDDFYNADEIYSEFRAAAKIIQDNNIRCSMHPDQFVVPASPKDTVVENSIRDLEQHAMIMDMLELPRSYDAPINIHMNCYNDGKFSEVIDRLEKVINRMSYSVRSRLVFENEDKPKSWNVYNLYHHLYKRIGVPITFDNLHHNCNPGEMTEQEAFDMSISTWPKDVVPLFHFSESLPGKNPRAHADFPTFLPNVYKNYNNDLHLDFEFKLKEIAINKISRGKLLTLCG